MSSPDSAFRRPLHGLRVLELAQVMAGPVTGLLLSDLGADVIKVEKFPGGDDARGFNAKTSGGAPPSFEVLNRGKRSIAVDLKNPKGRETLRHLVKQADVLTENSRPGAMDKLGLSAAAMREVNPALIYCSISGYGRQGPLASRGGFDLILQAFSGLISLTGEPDRPGVKPGTPIADINAGIIATVGILSAYIHRLRTGEGQWVETSLLQASMQQLYWYAALLFSGGNVPGRMGTAHPITAPYETYPCADGDLAVGGANQANWVRITEVLGHPEWQTDPRFADAATRLSNRAALRECMAAVMKSGTRDAWERKFTAAGVPSGPVNTVQEALRHPQAHAMSMVIDAQTADGGTRKMIGLPLHFDGGNRPATTPAPLLGQHSREVLAASGMAAAEIDRLLSEGIVHQAA